MSHPHAAEVSADHDDWSPHAAETFHELDRIGKAAAILLGLATLTHLLSTWSDWHTYGVVNKYLGGVPNVEDADLNKADAIARLTSIPNVVISVAAAVVFVLWLWRARLNSEVFCQADHRHSHGWVLTSWFCPGANLFYPRQIVTDVWAASHPDTPVWTDNLRRYRRAPIIGAWWACWLGAMILDVVVRRVLMWIDPTVPVLRLIAISATASVVMTASSAGLAAVIIRRVTWMQTSRPWIPWWDHREESRGSSTPAATSAASFPYAEAQRSERAYAENPYAELRPDFDQPLTEPLVAVAPAYQMNREPQLVNTARLDLGAQPAIENRAAGWSEQQSSDWTQPQPVNWSDAPNRSEPLGPVWSETRPTGPPPGTGPMSAPIAGPPAGSDPFDRPWLRQAERRPEPMPQPAPAPPPAPAPQSPGEDESQAWSPFTALVESWREQAEAEQAIESRWSGGSQAVDDAPGHLQSPGYHEPPSSYLEPSGSIAPVPSRPAPEPIEPPAHHDPLHDPIGPSWQAEPQPEPQPEPRWTESRWSDSYSSEPQPQWSEPEPEPYWSEREPEPHWSESQWTETPWSEPLPSEPELPASQWSEPEWSEQPYSEHSYSEQPYSEHSYSEQPYAEQRHSERQYSEAQHSEAARPEPHWSERPAWSSEPRPPAQPEQAQPPAQPQWSVKPAPSAQAGWSAEPSVAPGSPPRLSVVPPLPAPEPGVGPEPVADPAIYASAPNPAEPWRNTGAANQSNSPDLLSPSAPIPAPAGPTPAGPAPRHLATPQDPETAQPSAAASYVAQAPVVPGPPPAVQALLDQTATPPRRPATGTPPASQPVPRAQPASGPTPVRPAGQAPRSEQPGGQPPRAEQPGGQPSRDAAPRTYPRRRWTAG